MTISKHRRTPVQLTGGIRCEPCEAYAAKKRLETETDNTLKHTKMALKKNKQTPVFSTGGTVEKPKQPELKDKKFIDEQVRPDCPVLDMMMDQVKLELESSQLYMNFSVLVERCGYVNTAKFFMDQSLEERSHAIMFINELNKNGKKVELPTKYEIELPDGSKLGELLNAAMEHEVMISNSINCIYQKAMEHGAFMLLPFISSMMAEQVEEEQLYRSILRWFKLCDSAVDFELEILNIKGCGKHKIGNLPLE